MMAFASGCQEEKIREYQAPRDEVSPYRVNYQTPAGWKKRGIDPRQLYVAAFRVTKDGKTAEVTVTPLDGRGGGLLANVNRWRKRDLQLEPITEAELGQHVHTLRVADQDASYLDLSGPESAGAHRPRVLAVIAPRDDKTWFFKMIGPADLVGAQKAAFEAFVQSFTFGAPARNKDG